MAQNLPYVTAVGTLENMLAKIKTAAVPPTFNQEFVETKLLMKGGTARAVIPFVKKMGLALPEGTPTERYKAFRNPVKGKQAIADAMRELYAPLFEMNEYVHETDDKTLKGLIVEYTGSEPDSQVVKLTMSTFKALRNLADFETAEPVDAMNGEAQVVEKSQPITAYSPPKMEKHEGINLSYTINLNLPSSADVKVFDAIFKSLKEHLLSNK